MTPARSDIAIIGMACTFPGARDLRQYWENILAKVDAVSDAPPEWEADLFFDPDSEDNTRTYCRRGGFLGALAQFDPAEYGVMPQAVDGTEPDHFLALRTAGEAMADAGYLHNPKYRERTSIVIGRGTYVNRGNTTAVQHSLAVDGALRLLQQLHPEHTAEELALIRRELLRSLPPFHADTAPGLVPNVITGRIANRLDIMGPNYIVDAACASSLVAVDLAMQDLRSGRCDMALVGGVHASTTPVILIIFSQLKALSRAGRIRPFAAEADGTLLAEGVGLVVLKRLEDAEKDGDRIYAAIKGVGVASDGRALGLLAPRLEGEQLALRRAYEDARVDPASIHLVEAHGTATLVGDAVEVEALKNVLGKRQGELPRCALGSVKSMIGHTMPASGMAGLIKAALALHHKVLPPTLHCDTPNPRLGLEDSNFYLNSEARPWIHGESGHARRAGVNAFGFGGINAHAVMEEYAGPLAAPTLQHHWDTECLVLSGPDLPALQKEIERVRQLAEAAAGGEFSLKDLAWTLNCHTQLASQRLSIVASSREDLVVKLERAAAKLAGGKTRRLRDKDGIYYFSEPLGLQGKVAVLFPGEGAQYVNMLADLALHFPEVRYWFDLMDAAFSGHARGYRPSDAMFPASTSVQHQAPSRLHAMDAGAEAVFTGNQALFALLDKLKLRPDAMAGHSTGEHSALLAAGVVGARSRDELIAYVLGVNRVFEMLSGAGEVREGILLAVAGADHALLTRLVSQRPDLYIALDNCPHQVVLCGSEDAVAFVLRELENSPAVCQRLPMGRAYHTPLFENFASRLRTFFDSVPIQTPTLELYSCVTAARYPSSPDAIRSLAAAQWASAVRFRETVEAMHRDGVRVFVECGPRGNLTTFLDDTLRGKTYAAVPANLMHRSGIAQLNHLCAALTAHGVSLDLSALYERRAPALFPPSPPARPSRALPVATGLQPFRLPPGFQLPSRAVAVETPVTVMPAAPALDGRGLVMQQYFANMTEFLAAEQRMMSAFLAARNPVAAPAPAAAATTARPFVTQIVELDPGRRAVVRHRFSLDREPLFGHHTLGRSVSGTDPSLTGMPVVPLTVTMEILAEAASVLMPNQVLRGMREVRSSRWLTLDRELMIELTAEAVEAEPGAVTVRLRPADGPPLAVWAEGIMLFAPAYPPAPSPGPDPLRNTKASAWKPESLYRDGMFHGPAFMAVKSIDRSGENGCQVTLAALPRHELIAGEAQPAFLVDPVLLDATGQAVAFWSQEQLLPHGDIFPFRLEQLECYQPPSAPGSEFQCRVHVTAVSESTMSSNIDVTDSSGRLHVRLTGWHDRRFLLPRWLWELRISSGRTAMGKAWTEPLAGHAGAKDLACCLVDDLSTSLLESSHGIWAGMLAHLILSRRELAQWDQLRGAIDKRRFDWLRGRCAAKDALRRLILEHTGKALSATDVELIPDEWGRPRVEGPWIADLRIQPVVSISHSAESAVALAALTNEAIVGIDLESRDRDHGRFESIAFEESERRIIDAVQPARRHEWYLRMWCAREAVAKALGRGFEHGLRSLAVVKVEPESGVVHVELRKGLATEFPRMSRRPVLANTSSGHDFVCSTVVSSQGNPY